MWNLKEMAERAPLASTCVATRPPVAKLWPRPVRGIPASRSAVPRDDREHARREPFSVGAVAYRQWGVGAVLNWA